MWFWHRLLNRTGNIIGYSLILVLVLVIIYVIWKLSKKIWVGIKKLGSYIKKGFIKCKDTISKSIKNLTPDEKKKYKKELIQLAIIVGLLVLVFIGKYIEDNY